jgi:hypothetical protein
MEFNCDETIEQLTEMELKALVAELRSRVKGKLPPLRFGLLIAIKWIAV